MQSQQMTTPYLEVILGPMYSGKTTALVEYYEKYAFCGIPVTVINHSCDTRYDDELLSTHDKKMIPCVKAQHLRDIWNESNEMVQKSVAILINEGQFFDDLYDCVFDMLKNGKKVYVCGLDGDFQRNKFGQMLDIIPLCDKVVKLNALCSLCRDGTAGIFSHRISSETGQVVVGSSNYIPVCRKCYEKK